MAQKIAIDIVADTTKLVSGVNEANGQIDGMSSKLKGAAAAATAAASAFVLKQGISFLKDGIAEAQDAKIAMNNATTAFGEGSAALAKITDDAEKFGKALGMDNDDILKLATALGSRLPADAKALSAELVNTAKDIEAVTSGAVSAEAVTNKLAKAFADGQISAKELTKIFPDLEKATYDQAEALSKAGKNQDALTLLIQAAQKKYGDAAEKNVTSTQKFETALANLKETVGTKILPIVNQFIDKLTILLDWFGKQPTALQNIELGLLAIVAIGGPFLGFLASAKTSLQVLGITQAATTTATAASTVATEASTVAIGEATIAQRLLNFTILGFPGLWVIAAITAVIAIIVLLVKNWDTVTEVIGKVWDAIKNFASDAWDAIKGFGSRVGGFVSDLIADFKAIPAAMLGVGKDIVYGLWNGIKSVMNWLKEKIENSFIGTIIGKVNDLFGRKSPSKVFAAIGKDLVRGLAIGIETSKALAVDAVGQLAFSTVGNFNTPQLAESAPKTSPVSITINAGVGTDPYVLGRTVQSAISKYGRVSSKTGQYTQL